MIISVNKATFIKQIQHLFPSRSVVYSVVDRDSESQSNWVHFWIIIYIGKEIMETPGKVGDQKALESSPCTTNAQTNDANVNRCELEEHQDLSSPRLPDAQLSAYEWGFPREQEEETQE